jgi:hypothetical protein
MKFLENEKLAQLTAQMTDAVVGTGERVINGRIEAFTMKRAGTDKKLAHDLTEKYQAEIQIVETELAQFQKTIIGRKRSESFASSRSNGIGTKKQHLDSSHEKRVRILDTSEQSPGMTRKRSNSIGIPLVETKSKRTSNFRSRSDSYDSKSVLKSRSDISEPKSALRSSSDSALRSRSESFSSPADVLNSPLGDFHDTSTQRLMTNLIMTLNASFPDYDFSTIRPSHFARLPSLKVAINHTNEKLAELASNNNQGANFFSQLWNAIDDVIDMNDSEVYSYVPPQRDDDDDPLGFLTQTLDGTEDSDTIVPLWTMNFFFVNKSMKRILLFTCVQTMRNEVPASSVDDDDDGFVGASDGVKEAISYDNYGLPKGGFRSTRENFDEEDEEDYWQDFDMDSDAISKSAPPAAVA